MRKVEDCEEVFAQCQRQACMLQTQQERMQRQQERISRQRGEATSRAAAASVEPPLDDSPAEVERVVRRLLETV